MDKNGDSKIKINLNVKDYVDDAVDIIKHQDKAELYAETYKKAFDYTYTDNPNDIGGIFSDYIDSLYKNDAVSKTDNKKSITKKRKKRKNKK